MGQRVLITGISRHLAGRLAHQLEADPDIEEIVGGELSPPEFAHEPTPIVGTNPKP